MKRGILILIAIGLLSIILGCAKPYFEKCASLSGEEKEFCQFKTINDSKEYASCKYLEQVQIKDECFAYGASVTNDEKLCQNIENQDGKIACLIRTVGNPSICEELEGIRRDDCLVQIANNKADVTICDRVHDFNAKWANCYGLIVAKTHNEQLCASFKENERFYCLAFSTIKKGDFSICEGKPESKIECYASIGRVSGYYVCNNINITEQRDACFLREAELGAGETACDTITNSQTREKCVRIQQCEKPLGEGYGDACYFSAAHQLNDSSFCTKISDEGTKRDCKLKFGQV